MNTKRMTIEEICNELNNAAGNFRIGNLQNIRKELKSLTKKPTSEVFNYSTISDNYAFHVGGRSELQFNIGYEEEGLRYGFAFSLKPSQALPNPTIYNSAFSFKQNNYNLTINKSINTVAKSIDVTVRHTLIQIELMKQLASRYGASNVVAEHYHQGNRIDVVVNDKGNIYFYEIKVADSAKACIRQALGQLFEYSYFPNNSNAKKLIVAGESKLDNDCNLYIETLIRKFNIPLEYLQVTL